MIAYIDEKMLYYVLRFMYTHIRTQNKHINSELTEIYFVDSAFFVDMYEFFPLEFSSDVLNMSGWWKCVSLYE